MFFLAHKHGASLYMLEYSTTHAHERKTPPAVLTRQQFNFWSIGVLAIGVMVGAFL